MSNTLNVKNHTGHEKIIFTGIPNSIGDFRVELAGITYPDKQYRIRHNPSFLFVFEYVQEGCGYIEYDGLKLTVKAGDFYLIPCKTACVYYSDPHEPYKKIWFNACGGVIEKLLEAYHLDTPIVIARADVESRMKHLHNLLKQRINMNYNSPYTEEMMQFELGIHELIAFVSRCQTNTITPAKSLPEQVRDYLDQHLSEGLTIEGVAKHFFISRSYLIRSFQKKYNQSPYDYFLIQKIHVACNLLRQTTLPVQEIAARLAFSDAHYFSNIFKKISGCSPSKYRSGTNEEP